jgi:hypothetical protein
VSQQPDHQPEKYRLSDAAQIARLAFVIHP